MAKTTKKTEVKGIVFDKGTLKKIPITGNEYYDSYFRYREKAAYRVVDMPCERFMELCYSQQPLKDQKVKNKDLSGKIELPILDIDLKHASGRGRVLVAQKQGAKEVPVLIIARKESHIDWYLNRKNIKSNKG